MKISSMKLVIFIYFAALFLSRVSLAGECKELGTELDSMRKAQNQIMISLVKNHESFADNMVEVSQSNLSIVKKTAKSYRVRGEKAQIIADKLDIASADLITKVKKCLK
ncbi:MAG: hypothetical protein AABY64_05550 [Bdellovibrionota bacterium]